MNMATSWKRKGSCHRQRRNNLRRRIQEALDILGQSLTLNRDGEFELPALYRDTLANNLVYPS